MNIKEIQAAGVELDRLIRQRPHDAVAIAEQLRRWDTAGLPRYENKQVARMVNEGVILLSRSFGEGLLAHMTKDEARARL